MREPSRIAGIRTAGTLAIAAIVAAACGSGATPSSIGSPLATPASAPPATASAQPYQSSGSGELAFVEGNAHTVAPAQDNGAGAAAELNDFGFDLLRHLDSSGNLCASPTSVALALAMIEPGAKGQTAAEMATVLHSFGAADQDGEIVALLDSLRSKTFYADSNGQPLEQGASPDPAAPDPIVQLNVANQAFLQKSMPFDEKYLDDIRSTFGSGIGTLDFNADPEAARLAINKWANDQTNGRIPSILQPGDIQTATRLALADAIYLKAAWDRPFDPTLTKSRNFTTAAGSVVSVPTMASELQLAYAAGKGYRAVELPMAGNSLTMTIVEPDDMAAFVGSLDETRLAAIVAAESSSDVELTLPRFSIDTRFDLTQTLAAMGMPTVFSDAADLSGIAPVSPLNPQGLEIAKVVHQANIDVVEQGTTAAAVTVAIGVAAGIPETPPTHVQFNVDKPFVYLIRDTSSGAVLFMGRVDDPSR